MNAVCFQMAKFVIQMNNKRDFVTNFFEKNISWQ